MITFIEPRRMGVSELAYAVSARPSIGDWSALAVSASLLPAAVAEELAEQLQIFSDAAVQELSAKLAAAPAAAPPRQAEVKNAVLVRNGLLSLLMGKIALVRKGAARVFRGFPETYREVTSTYERRKRAATRRAKSAKAKGDDGGRKEGARRAQGGRRLSSRLGRGRGSNPLHRRRDFTPDCVSRTKLDVSRRRSGLAARAVR